MKDHRIIDGREVLASHITTISNLLAQRPQKKIAIIKFDYSTFLDAKIVKATEISTNSKIKAISKIGLEIKVFVVSFDIKINEFINLLEKLNIDDNIIGVLIQQKIPSNLIPYVIKLTLEKDLDGITKNGVFKTSSVAESVVRIVKLKINEDSKIALVGSNGYVGKDITYLLELENINCVKIDLNDDINKLKDANFIITAVGKPNIIKDCIKYNDIIIDVGFNIEGVLLDQFVGDVLNADYNILKMVTPVPGGMGPLSIATLLERIVIIGYGIQIDKWTV